MSVQPNERRTSKHGVEIAGELYQLDQRLNQIVREGVPAVLEACRHTRQVIKQDNLFLISDTDGGIYNRCNCGTGLYFQDTRFLNGFELELEGESPTLLSSTADKNYMSRIEFMNSELHLKDGTHVPQESLYISSQRLIKDYIHEKLEFVNYNHFDVTLQLRLVLSADFSDMFEVRGAFRGDRGEFFHPKITEDAVLFSYLGADQVMRRTRIRFKTPPSEIKPIELSHATGAEVAFEVTIKGGGGRSELELTLEPLIEEAGATLPEPTMPFTVLQEHLQDEQDRRRGGFTRLSSDHEIYNMVLARNVLDLESLTTMMEDTGPYIVAGIPWYACPFGRDALITAIQSLMLGPELAKGTVRYLAKFQGRDLNDFRDEEPGKILHEVRFGELTNLGQVPHSPYYGTIDATPLFLVTISEIFRWTGDLGFVREMWESIEQALMWIDAYGDLDGDGFLEYATRSERGLFNQCWKDSNISNIRPDFSIAQPPIAVAEVQGYVYDAKRRVAELCYLMDLRVMGDRLIREAEELKVAFNKRFWLEEEGFYALALDADKQPVRTLTSNIGHCLWSGIIDKDRQGLVAEQMLSAGMFSGWGIRTLSADMPPYNPLSYHNGSIWPHDNSLIAKGMADTGHVAEAQRVMNALYQAALHFPYYRLPELFCGFSKQGEMDRPVPYPVACAPQAWAAGAPFLLLQSILGLNPDASKGHLVIRQPSLPPWLENVYLKGLRIGESSVDLRFMQMNGVTTVTPLDKSGPPLKVFIEG
ncbi:MAG: glycogen debranching N-terminal domain-containing protein [Candidatus Sericytochromatia bacterium]